MVAKGYQHASLKKELVSKLTDIQVGEAREGHVLTSVAEIIGYLASIYPEYKNLKAHQEKQAPVPRAR